MGKGVREKDSCALPDGNSHHNHSGRVWGMLHIMKHQHWNQVKKKLSHRRSGCIKQGADIPGTSDDSGVHSIPEDYKPHAELSNSVDKGTKLKVTSPPAKNSIRSRLKSLLNEDIYRRSRHKRSSTCPTKSHLNHIDSVHNSEVDPLSELFLDVQNPEPVLETFQNHLGAGTLDELPPATFSEKPIANNDKCVDCGTMFSRDMLEHNKIHKHLCCPSQGGPEEKLMNAQILTTDASPHLFKDFLDALDVINTNKDFLLEYIQDPSSTVPFETHNQQSFNDKSRRSKSLSFPVSASSLRRSQDSVPGQIINQMVDDFFDSEKEKLQNQSSNIQNESMHESSEDSNQQFIPSSSSNSFNKCGGERESNSSSVSSQTPNNGKARHFRDLRKKMKHIIEDGRNEKHRITMDAILDKIPRGKRLTKNVKKLIHDKSIDSTNGEGEDRATSSSGSHLSSNSFNKRHPPPMRTSSLRDSAGRYSQLYKTCFNSEVKCPKTDNLRLRTEERNSVLKTPPKSFQRFLSMPNLKSYFHQNEELPSSLSPKNAIKKFGDRIISTNVIDQQQRRFDHNSDDSKSQILAPTFADNTNHESSLNADQKQLLISSASKSGIDFSTEAMTDNIIGIADNTNHESSLNADLKQLLIMSASKSGLDFSTEAKEDNILGIEGLSNLRHSEHDIEAETESTPVPAEANSVFSSDTCFLDFTFDLENLNILEEESDLEIKPGQDDGLDDMAEQLEAKEEHPEEVGTLSKCFFNYEIPCVEVDPSDEAAFNYVRKVLELSGFTGHDSFGIWYSDNQPLDPSMYEELEGCLFHDSDSSSSSGEGGGGECNHLLLFDTINEGLLEIFGRSYNYYPRPLSCLSHVHPLPAGENVLHKVWILISWYMDSPTYDPYPSLDYYVSRDLAKFDGWMNLQFDSECVGLGLDDLIFDDLLEEIIST